MNKLFRWDEFLTDYALTSSNIRDIIDRKLQIVRNYIDRGQINEYMKKTLENYLRINLDRYIGVRRIF